MKKLIVTSLLVLTSVSAFSQQYMAGTLSPDQMRYQNQQFQQQQYQQQQLEYQRQQMEYQRQQTQMQQQQLQMQQQNQMRPVGSYLYR